MPSAARFLIRPAEFDDAPALGHIHVETWRAAYHDVLPDAALDGLSDIRYAAFWAEVLDDEERPGHTFVAETEREGIVGFADCAPHGEDQPPGTGEITAVYVLPGWRRCGIGRALIEACAAHLAVEGARTLISWTMDSQGACGFYEALGAARVRDRQVFLDGAALDQVCFGWSDIAEVVDLDCA